jgi:serine/threonine protein kinase
MPGTSELTSPTIPGYEILRVLGQGGMGTVYLARQQALNRLVCVKVLSNSQSEEAELSRARFGREAELLGSVSHPNILSVFDFGTTSDLGLPFLVTEYVEGGDLRGLLSRGRPLPIDQVRSIVSQVGEALKCLHEKGIIHRDLKPENVLRPTDSQFKVCDFGLAVMQDQAGLLTRPVRGLGTMGYVSPEQQYGLKVDERSDQYSLAALAYELLTGRRALGVFSPPSRVNPQLTRAVDEAILGGLAEDPRDRHPSVQHFLTALNRALDQSLSSVRNTRWALAGLLFVLAAIVVARMIRPGSQAQTPRGNDTRIIPSAAAKPDPNPDSLQAEKKHENLPAKPTERSRELTRLIELRAYKIWAESGRPEGAAGEAAKERNWIEAERQIGDEVKARAYQLWQKQGCPLGAAGEAVREKNLRSAEAELLQETEAEFSRNPID